MSDMLLQIYTRHERADVTRKYVFLDIDDGEKAHEDREWLLTEVERQRADIKRLRADLATQQGCCDGAAAQDAHVRQEREEHRAEVERQRAEIERLRETNKQLVSGIDTITRSKNEEIERQRAEIERLRAALRDIERGDYSDPMCVRTPEQRAREALEGKP